MLQGPFKPIYPNPYIVGNPIRSRDMFFGRMDEFRHIAQALDNGQKTALIVLFGERRSGKSSILYQIQNGQLGQAFLPIFVDLQIMAGIANEAEFFGRIITDTGKALGKAGPEITPYILQPDDSNPAERFRQYLRALQAHFPGRALLVLIDEYEILENKITEGCLSRHVLTFFGGLLESEQVSFVFTGSRKLELHNAELWGSALLQKATSRKISFLTPDDTARLVTQPLANKVTFAPAVIEQIYTLTAGQPFYTQLICQNLVYHLNEVKKYSVDCADLEKVVAGILENPPPQLIFNWGEHPSEHKLALALLAEFSRKPGRYLSTASIRHRVKRSKLDLVLNDAKLKTWLTDLCKDEYLLQQDYRFCFRLDLFRRWIRHDHNIWQVKKEIGQEELDRICEREKIRRDKIKKTLTRLERIAFVVAIAIAVALGKWVINLLTEKQVNVSANGGPFSVWVNDDSIGTTSKDNPTQFVIGQKWVFFEKKLKEGETYRFSAKLLKTGETTPDTSVTISKSDPVIIKLKFSEYPVTVVTDAASIIATLGGDTVRTQKEPDPWQCTFHVCAGSYKLFVKDPSTGEVKEDTIKVSKDSVHKYIDFDQVVAITLQANVPFTYEFERNRLKGEKSKLAQDWSVDSTLVALRGCSKGSYRFTFINPRTDERIPKDKFITTNDSINVNFSDTVVITLRANVPFDYEYTWNFSQKEKGKASNSTLVLKGRPKGFYQFTCTDPRTGKKVLKNRSIKANATISFDFPDLVTVTHRLRIETDPSGAEVILNSKPFGQKTPFLENLPEKFYVIELSKENYEPYTTQIDLKQDTTLPAINLTPQYGYLRVIVMDNLRKSPTGVSVYGKKDDWNNEVSWGDARKLARSLQQLMVGQYKIRVVSDEYREVNRDVPVFKNDTSEVEITLEKK